MQDNFIPEGTTRLPWPDSDPRAKAAAAPKTPGSEAAAPAVVELLNHAVQGAHHTIDRLAERAAPAARQLGETVAAAEDALQAKTGQLRDTRDHWVENARTTVRGKPLVCVMGAFALGAVIARILR